MVQTAQIGRKLARKRIRKTLEEAAFRSPMTGARSETRPFYETATPDEWLAAFTEWTESHRDLPRVPAAAFSRETDYEDRL